MDGCVISGLVSCVLMIAAESDAPRTGHGRRRIHTTRPASDDLKLVLSDSLRASRRRKKRDRISCAKWPVAWRSCRRTLERYMMTLAPLGAIAYLCTSQEILHRVKEERMPRNQRLSWISRSSEEELESEKILGRSLTSSLPELGNQTARSRTQPVRGTGRGTNRGSSRRASRAGVGSPGPRAPRCLFESRVPESRIRGECVSALLGDFRRSVRRAATRTLRVP